MKDDSNAPTVVDLFAGAGGLSEGLLRAGLNVIASVELHPQAALTHAFNHPETKVLVGDVRDLDPTQLRGALHGHSLDVLVGGPPCQGFSTAGKKAATDPRNGLFRSFLEVIDALRPRICVLENVPGFQTMYGGAMFEEAVTGLGALGYRTTSRIMVAAEYGVPQTRKRFIMVGWDESIPGFDWPAPTHRANEQLDLQTQVRCPLVTAGDVLDGLSFLEPGFVATRYRHIESSTAGVLLQNNNDLLFNHLATRHRPKAVQTFKQIPVGGSIRDVPSAKRNTKKVTLSRLSPLQLSNTVVSLPDDQLHYAHDRILSVRECARLQTFDDDFVILGKRTSGFVERRVDVPQYTQVGNAVPPMLGAAIGRALLASLEAGESDRRDLARRRRRHQLVCGSSAYAGYTLSEEAIDEIMLRTVGGDLLNLPIAPPEDLPVHSQPEEFDWTKMRNPRRGQWAPGVEAKLEPAWVGTR
ncbi:MAG: DNA cytosine methyltransferase [bacterium]|nr:DNA cytosine methyltransferase [bacterium]